MDFIPSLSPPPLTTDPVRLYVFRGSEILLPDTARPRGVEVGWQNLEKYLGGDRKGLHYLGQREGLPCFAAEAPAEFSSPPGTRFVAARDAFIRGDPGFVRAVSAGLEILSWDRSNRFCGQCGEAMEDAQGERARRCPSCGLVRYPRLSPAVIVAVRRDQEILLARAHRFPPGMYSVLAGFVEAGETLEECIHREIDEEVGIRVRDVRYFGSQSWPFPHSLMIAFTASYDGGILRPCPDELADAGWYSARELPQLPPSASIARRLIDDFARDTEGEVRG